MARANFEQTSFRNGQWSNFSQGRTDLKGYYEALAICRDYHPVDAGALVRRSGSQFVATVDALQGGTTPFVKLMPFDDDDDEHHVVVVLPDIIQSFSSGTFEVETPVTILNVDGSDPSVFTTDGVHSLTTGDKVVLQPVAGTSLQLARSLINVQFTVTVLTTTTFTLTMDGARSGLLNSDDFCFHGGTVAQIKETATPYSITDLTAYELKYTQDAHYLFMFHPSYAPRLLDKDLVLSTATFTDGPYEEVNTTTTTMALSATTGSVTVTASAVAGINEGSGFLSTDINRLIRWKDPAGNWTWLQITAVADTTHCTASILGDDASAGTATVNWRMGLYSDTTGHPTHGVFHEGRLWLCSDAQTGRIDGSEIIPYGKNSTFGFAPTSADGTVADANAVAAVFNSQGRNRITWLSADDTGLIGGSSDGIWIIQASAQDDPITPTSIQARRKSAFKASDAQPALVNRSTVFIGDLTKEVIEVRRYDAGFDAKIVSRDGENLTAKGLEEIHYSHSPFPTLWARTSDNQLIGCAFRRDKDGEQTGWHEHNVAYTLDPEKVAATGKLQALTVVRQSDLDGSNTDTLWMVVERNGNYCLEYMTPLFDQSRIQLEGHFADSAQTYDQSNFSTAWNMTNPATNEFTFYGLWHLEGNTVDVTWRGIDMGTAVVSNGQVTKTIPEEAMSAPSSYVDSTNEWYRVRNYTYTENQGAISRTTATDISDTTINPPPNGALTLVGEDGVDYYFAGPQGADEIWLVTKSTGAATQILVASDCNDEFRLRGMDPSYIINDLNSIDEFFVVEGTPYFVTLHQRSFIAGGVSYAMVVFYWKIDDTGNPVCVGGFCEKNAAAVELNSIQNHVAVGYIGGGASIADRTANDIVLFFNSGASGIIPTLLRLPNIDSILIPGWYSSDPAHTGTWSPYDSTVEWDDRQLDLTGTDEWGNNFALAGVGGTDIDAPFQNRAAFLPDVSEQKIHLISYVPRDICQSELDGSISASNAYTLAQAAVYPNGFITAITIEPSGAKGLTATKPAIWNCRFRDSNNNSIVPFADDGFPYLTDYDGKVGSSRTSGGDAYHNPLVTAIDANNRLKPWIVAFPKVIHSDTPLDTTGTYMAFRCFEWNPVGGYATQLWAKEGSLYNTNTEYGVSIVNNIPCTAFAMFVNGSTDMEVMTCYLNAGVPMSASYTIATWATMSIDVDDDLAKVEALNRGFDAVIGLNYVSQFQLLRPQNGSNAGPDLGKTRRVDRFAVHLDRTGPFQAGTDLSVQAFMDDHIPDGTISTTGQRALKSGVYGATVSDVYSTEGQLAFQQNRPGPGSFLAVSGYRNTQDR